ncbi:phage portal protein [Sphingobium yanoikuyae]|uniref:phage portal protein n=1 Tax=Sphingobium yanoikuyae TaxID=13690 RepID=UPI00345F0004
MAWITDSLRGAIDLASRLNPFSRAGGVETAIAGHFTHQLAIAAYMSSGMLRKVIAIPAADRTQKWRDWQADKDDITKIEAEEKRLGLRAKTKEAEVLRGTGGGAFILVTAGDHDSPLTPESIGPGGLVAVNVVSRWEITPKDFEKDLASPYYRQPRYFEVNGGEKTAQRIHPSRVVCFRGDPIPSATSFDEIETFWGDCRLLQVFTAVQNSDHTQAWFVELVKKAKLLRIGIPDLLDMLSSEEGKRNLNERIALIASGESTLNATVYRSGTGQDDPGEKIDDYQINFSGIPAFMDAVDQRLAAVSGIPFTKLMGRSPAGMNATGDSDMNNWWDTVGDGQENETRPCLEQLDPFLLRSAGVSKPDDIWWLWAPLRKPTEKEEAETFKLLMEAIGALIDGGMVPREALAQAVQNLIEERGYMPGLADALKKIPEAERYGLSPEDDGTDDDPSALQAGKEGDPASAGSGGSGSGAARRAVTDAVSWLSDATPRPLYVQRKLLNAADLIAWAKDNGFATTLPASDMHVTVLYSRSPVDPMKMGRDWREDEKGQIIVRPGGPRVIEKLGENAVVLRFACPDLDWRHKDMIEAGGSHDWPEYAPHVTISYTAPEGVDIHAIRPFNGALRFGPEIFEALDLDWKSKIAEA